DEKGTIADAQPRFVYGSTTAVTMCNPRKTSVTRARLRCSPAVRNRGHPFASNRRLERMPSATTAVSRTRLTAPAPRVVYHSTWSVKGALARTAGDGDGGCRSGRRADGPRRGGEAGARSAAGRR